MTDLESSWIDHIVNKSLSCERGDRVIVESFNIPGFLLHRISSRIGKTGAHAINWPKTWASLVALVNNSSDEMIRSIAEQELSSLKTANKFLSIQAASWNNMRGISTEGIERWLECWFRPVHYEHRLNCMRSCSVAWPDKLLAEQSGVVELEEMYYAATAHLTDKFLAGSLESVGGQIPPNSEVRLVGPGTDLMFELISTPWVCHLGECNLPDGRACSAPVRDSVNGHLTVRGPVSFMGMELEFLWLEIENGKIALARTQEQIDVRLNKVLMIDQGATYIGGVGLGLNRSIRIRIGDPAWDSACLGSLCINLGESRSSSDNGNRSLLQWDLVLHLSDYKLFVNHKEVNPSWVE